MAINFQLFIFESEEEQVVFCPLLPKVYGKGPTVGAALEMWQMRTQQQIGELYNFDCFGEEDLNTSRKVWYGRSEKDEGIYIVDDEITDRGVAFCPRTGQAESFRWTKFRNQVRNGSNSPLSSFSLVSGLFDERVRCSLSHPIYPQTHIAHLQHHHPLRSLTPHHMN